MVRRTAKSELGPFSNYRLTARLILANRPGLFAKVATTLESFKARLGAVHLVSASSDSTTRDITFDVPNEQEGDRLLEKLGSIPGIEAALPVMEGKVRLFKEFGGIDAWPLCLNTRELKKPFKS